MEEKRFRTIFYWSIAFIVCVCFIPTYHWLGGLFPELDYSGRLDSWALISLLLNLFEEDHDSNDIWPVLFLLAEFIPVIFTMMGSRKQNRRMCISSSIIAITCMLIISLRYMAWIGNIFAPRFALSQTFGTSEGSVSIGFWIALAIHIICLVLALRITTDQDMANEK